MQFPNGDEFGKTHFIEGMRNEVAQFLKKIFYIHFFRERPVWPVAAKMCWAKKRKSAKIWFGRRDVIFGWISACDTAK